jgi:cellulose synthase/poly-beta-1,6-N-acetylglucosamine synthase-like glycosyltransferase
MTYLEWLERFASLTSETRANLHQRILALAYRPMISVILPVYNGDLSFLGKAIASVRRQIYEDWELCLADDASTDSRIKPFLEGLAREDRRINVLFREQNGLSQPAQNSPFARRGGGAALLDQG